MQTQAHRRHDNKHSSLIMKDDNDQVFSLLGVRCQSLVTAVVQLFVTHPPHHSQWVKKDTGILCFVKDNYRKNYFFRLYCLKRNSMIWEQEVYTNMEYINSCDFLHTFEGDECMVALNFANVLEAHEMKDIVDRKLLAKRRREEEKSRNRSVLNPKEQSPRLPNMNDISIYRKTTNAAERNAKRRRNITKADIGNPSEFRHVSHVGWDPDKGFDINCQDPALNQIFEEAGVSEEQLRNKKTREFIYDFINTHGGRQAVQQEAQQTRKTAPAPPSPVSGPPVPPRGAARASTRAAPPPPPTSSSQAHRNPQTLRNIQASGAPPPPPSSNTQQPIPPTCVAPPPPPLPPPCMEATSVGEPHAPTGPDMHSALMESIRGGTVLKSTNVVEKPSQSMDNPRGNLMSEIRKGFQLKPANEREIKPTSPIPEQEHVGQGGLAGALARALAERNRVTHSEDDSTSDTDSNDEWDM